jgi:hypothetical protein
LGVKLNGDASIAWQVEMHLDLDHDVTDDDRRTLHRLDVGVRDALVRAPPIVARPLLGQGMAIFEVTATPLLVAYDDADDDAGGDADCSSASTLAAASRCSSSETCEY